MLRLQRAGEPPSCTFLLQMANTTAALQASCDALLPATSFAVHLKGTGAAWQVPCVQCTDDLQLSTAAHLQSSSSQQGELQLWKLLSISKRSCEPQAGLCLRSPLDQPAQLAACWPCSVLPAQRDSARATALRSFLILFSAALLPSMALLSRQHAAIGCWHSAVPESCKPSVPPHVGRHPHTPASASLSYPIMIVSLLPSSADCAARSNATNSPNGSTDGDRFRRILVTPGL
jgi:hypothetical protein